IHARCGERSRLTHSRKVQSYCLAPRYELVSGGELATAKHHSGLLQYVIKRHRHDRSPCDGAAVNSAHSRSLLKIPPHPSGRKESQFGQVFDWSIGADPASADNRPDQLLIVCSVISPSPIDAHIQHASTSFAKSVRSFASPRATGSAVGAARMALRSRSRLCSTQSRAARCAASGRNPEPRWRLVASSYAPINSSASTCAACAGG